MWRETTITTAGIELLNSYLTGSVLTFTSAAAGTGNWKSSVLPDKQALVSQQQTVDLLAVEQDGETVRLKMQITSEDLEAGYQCQQVGIWAKADSGTPVLFFVMQDPVGLYVPGEDETPDFVLEFSAIIAAAGEGSVTAEIDPMALATTRRVKELITAHDGSAGAHAELRALIGSPFTFKGSVAAETDLPGSGNATNDAYYVVALGCLMAWNNTSGHWYQATRTTLDYTDQIAAMEAVQERYLGALALHWVPGFIGTTAPGASYAATNRCRVDAYFPTTAGEHLLIYIPEGYRITIILYDAEQVFLGRVLRNSAEAPSLWRWVVPADGYPYQDSSGPTGATGDTRYIRVFVQNQPTMRDMDPAECADFMIFHVDRGSRQMAARTGGRTLEPEETVAGLTTPGTYVIPNGIADAPLGTPCVCYVDNVDGYVIQRFYTNYRSGWRRTTTSSGQTWGRLHTDGYLGNVQAGDDADALVQEGVLYRQSSALTAANFPERAIGWLEIMGVGGSTATGVMMQRFTVGANGNVYVRHRSAGSSRKAAAWGAWQQVNPPAVLVPLDAEQALAITMAARAAKTEWSPVVDDETADVLGIPVASGAKVKAAKTDPTVEWDVYPVEELITGLPYSKTANADNGLFFNRRLETFFSALKNPRSILYTTWAGHPRNGLKACMYGTACSSFASALLGYTICYNTASLMDLGDPVSVGSGRDLKPGMLMLKKTDDPDDPDDEPTYHTIVIKSVVLRVDGTMAVTVAEAVAPITRERTYSESQILAMIAGGYGVYAFDDVDFTSPDYKGLTVEEYAEDVIPEYGCNTWYRVGTAIKVRLANAGYTLHIKSPLGGWTEVEPTGDHQPDVYGVMDISDLIVSEGVYELTTDETHESVTCKLALATPGAITYHPASHSFTVGACRGCVPTWYEFYVSGAGASARPSGLITDPEAEIVAPPSVYSKASWGVRVYFETGYGCFHEACAGG